MITQKKNRKTERQIERKKERKKERKRSDRFWLLRTVRFIQKRQNWRKAYFI